MGKVNEACPLGVAPSVSTTCMLALGDALAFTVMKARNFSVEDYVRFHPGGSLGAKLMTVEQSMMFRPGEKLPLADAADTIGPDAQEDQRRETSRRRHGCRRPRQAGRHYHRRRPSAAADTAGPNGFELKAADVMTANCKTNSRRRPGRRGHGDFPQVRIDELPVVDADDRPVGLIDVQDIVTIKVVG